MEEAPEDFVGSLLRDNPEANPSHTSPDLDDSHAPPEVQPLRSRMGPPPERVRVPVPKPSKGKSSKEKSSKEPPTLEEVKIKTIPDQLRTPIPLEGKSIDTPSMKINTPQGPKALSKGTSASISKDTTLFWEFFNYGLRLSVLGFVDEVLMTLDHDAGQLMPFAWLVLTVFQVACPSVGVLPDLALFSVMYNVIHKGPLTYFQVASPS
ncbi:hypothetical protein LIER_00512 [Lithospermum erythrorhizon]|uniref:Uncharacterized protein n=1 Tax=Lithospermum erythrorhizon TaxID=34254 RepID=A0AAV3NHL7_LITER